MKRILLLVLLGTLWTTKSWAQMPVYDASSSAQLIAIAGSIKSQLDQASRLLNIMDETKQVRQMVSTGVKALTNVHQVITTTSTIVNNARNLSNMISQSKALTPAQAVQYSQRCLTYIEVIQAGVQRLSKLLSDNVFEIEEDARISMIQGIDTEMALKQNGLDQIKREIVALERRKVLTDMANLMQKQK